MIESSKHTELDVQQDIKAAFQQEYGPVTVNWHQITPQQNEMFDVHFTVSTTEDVVGRFIGPVQYIDNRLHRKLIKYSSTLPQ